MMNDEKYNGWTNYETWNVNLWLTSNDESTYRFFVEQAQLIFEASSECEHFSKLQNAKFELRDFIFEHIEELNPLAEEASLYSDILRANLSRGHINYYEIAEGFYELEVDEK